MFVVFCIHMNLQKYIYIIILKINFILYLLLLLTVHDPWAIGKCAEL